MYELEVGDECFDQDYLLYKFDSWDDFYDLLYNCIELDPNVVCDYDVIEFSYEAYEKNHW